MLLQTDLLQAIHTLYGINSLKGHLHFLSWMLFWYIKCSFAVKVLILATCLVIKEQFFLLANWVFFDPTNQLCQKVTARDEILALT